MKHQYIAYDLGASSGRTILGKLENGRLELEEISRFYNGIIRMFEHFYWDYGRLFDDMKNGLQLAWKNGARPACLGIDTWGVDFGLFTRDGEFCGLPYAHRDPQTTGMLEELYKVIPQRRLYELTGIQFIPINTLVQLFALVHNKSPLLDIAKTLLLVPDVFTYLFTGVKKAELTFASTSQFYNPNSRQWEDEILQALGLSKGMLAEIIEPGTVLGPVMDNICKDLGVGPIPVVAVASHDTASAVVSVPTQSRDYAYISAGTWCLMGIEEPEPIITDKTLAHNFSNEQGVDGTTRLLKNIMGLWMIQECRRIWKRKKEYTFGELVELAYQAEPFKAIINPDYVEFLNPPNMVESVQNFCRNTGQPVPETEGEVIRVIIEGLALRFGLTVEHLREVSRNPVNRIHIVGGGCRNEMLNQFTADAAGIPVVAGPVEATATGNLVMQGIAMGHIDGLEEGRRIVADSNEVKTYQPRQDNAWREAGAKFKEIAAWEGT